MQNINAKLDIEYKKACVRQIKLQYHYNQIFSIYAATATVFIPALEPPTLKTEKRFVG